MALRTRPEAFKDYPDVVGIMQMCEMLGGIGIKSAYKLLRSGEIKSFLIGGKYIIPKQNIMDFLGLLDH